MIIKRFNGEKQKLIDSSILDVDNIDDVEEFEYKCSLIEEQQRKDTIRQDWLEHMGYKVLRFTNEEVLFDTDRVIENIKTNFI